MQQAKCEMEVRGDALNIKIFGEVDHHSASPLRDEIDRAIFRYRAVTVILNLSSVSFMDSAGLGLILGRFARVSDLGGRMIIADPSVETEKILQLAGVDRLMTVQSRKGAI